MKFSVKLIAATLCAAMLCVPALAAVSATGAGAYVPNPQYTVISGTVAHQKDGGHVDAQRPDGDLAQLRLIGKDGDER